MNQTRTFLLIAWLTVAFMLYMQWGQAPQGPAPTATTTAPPALPASLPPAPAAPATPPTGLPAVEPGAVAGAPVVAAATVPTAPATPVVIENDVLRLTVDLRGGRLIGAELRAYPLTKTANSANVRLLDLTANDYFIADAGLLDAQGQPLSGAATFAVEQRSAEAVTLAWTDPTRGLSLRKSFRLSPGSYVVAVRQELVNGGNAPLVGYVYEELARTAPPARPSHSGLTDPEAYSFIGAAWYSPDDKFEKRAFADFRDDGPLSKDATGGWVAMLQHHFLAAWVPAPATQRRFLLDEHSAPGAAPVYRVRAVAGVNAAPGATVVDETRLWVGPKLQKALDQLDPNLKLSVDYGWLTFIAQPLFLLLSWLHGLLGNWGWAIIAIVVLLKIALYWLSAKQYQSMAKLRSVQPRIEALKERYGDDRQKFQVAMMELYKKEKINPVGGCLPILLTIPIFIALYWVLLESVELRHAPWIGWIDNLTAADPYFVLPALNLVVMYLTQKLTPTPGMDPMQKKMMQWMPIVFGVMMAFFPAGLVLYWCTNGLLGLLQQWLITKRHGEKTAGAASAG